MSELSSIKIHSMTGFGRSQGLSGCWSWAWEIRSVNGRGLEIRLRAPTGFEAVEAAARPLISERMKRGACHGTLTASRENAEIEARIDRKLLQSLIDALESVSLNPNVLPARLDGLLALKGLVEFSGGQESDEEKARLEADVLAGLAAALEELCAMRAIEGAALGAVLKEKVDRIAKLRQAAEDCPGRRPDAVKARLARMTAMLQEAQNLDPARLHQEAVLLAAKADVREELDRLAMHCAAAHGLLEQGGAIGRKLDFLAQEFVREVNTLCAKSNDSALTAIGLEMKLEVEQFREQAQNVE